MNAGISPQPQIDPIAAVESSRSRGAACIDAVGLSIAEALAHRATAQQGEAREWLIRRVEERLRAIHARMPDAGPCIPATDDASPARQGALAQLAELVDRLGRSTAPLVASPAAKATSTPPAAAIFASPRPLKAVEQHQGTWARLRVETRLREALAQVPVGAGPLNTSRLVNRALQAMRDLSPEYLDAFMSHADTLLRLEQASGGNLPTKPQAGSAAKPRAGSRGSRKD